MLAAFWDPHVGRSETFVELFCMEHLRNVPRILYYSDFWGCTVFTRYRYRVRATRPKRQSFAKARGFGVKECAERALLSLNARGFGVKSARSEHYFHRKQTAVCRFDSVTLWDLLHRRAAG